MHSARQTSQYAHYLTSLFSKLSDIYLKIQIMEKRISSTRLSRTQCTQTQSEDVSLDKHANSPELERLCFNFFQPDQAWKNTCLEVSKLPRPCTQPRPHWPPSQLGKPKLGPDQNLCQSPAQLFYFDHKKKFLIH